MISTFIHFIRNKINPLRKTEEVKRGEMGDDVRETKEIGITEAEHTIYVGIEDTDLQQRVHHNICNLIGLTTEELDYIRKMDSKHMFEIVKLLNQAVVSVVDEIMEID